MAEIVNFIPSTVADCRRLIETLDASAEGATIIDRFGAKAELSASECKELARLTRLQIGEKPVAAKPKANLKNNFSKKSVKK